MATRNSTSKQRNLSRRERQIMDIVYRRGRVTIRGVLEDLADPPGYSAVRALVGVLEDKGHLRHEREGNRYIYRPTVEPSRAGRSALAHLLDTFFAGSASEAMTTLLELKGDELSSDDLDELGALIDGARQEGGDES